MATGAASQSALAPSAEVVFLTVHRYELKSPPGQGLDVPRRPRLIFGIRGYSGRRILTGHPATRRARRRTGTK